MTEALAWQLLIGKETLQFTEILQNLLEMQFICLRSRTIFPAW